MKHYFWIWILLSPSWLAGQSISIDVTAAETGEALYHAHALNHKTGSGKVSDESGRIRLEGTPGDSISISYVGYRDTGFFVMEGIREYEIVMNIRPLREVVVFSEEPFNLKSAAGLQEVAMEFLEAIPAFNGDPDIIKAVTFLPGITGGKEGYSHLSVRGGNIDENLILLDGAPLYNINHFGGFVSMFHPDMISSIDMYKGYWPSRFGGRLSSVLGVQSRSGNFKEHVFQADISPLSTKAHISGPIWKDKISYIVGGRRTFIDLLLLRFLAKSTRSGKRPGSAPLFTFYDTNAKISARISDNQNLSVSAFRGSDRNIVVDNESYYKGEDENNTLNQSYMLNYSYYPSSSTALKAHLSSSFYRHFYENHGVRLTSSFDGPSEEKDESYEHTGNSIQTYKAQVYGSTEFSSAMSLDYGMDYEALKYSIYLNRYNKNVREDQYITMDTLSITTGESIVHLSSLFSDALFFINPRLRVKAGLRLPYYRHMEFTTWMYEPKTLLSFDLTPHTTVNAGYNRQQQYNHALSYADDGFFREFYMASDDKIPTSVSHQWSTGLFYHFNNEGSWLRDANFSLELYFKKQSRLTKFLPYIDPERSVVNYRDHLLQDGEANTYGLELLFQKTVGKFHGSLAYTYTHSQSQFEGFNHGKAFSSDFEAKHQFDFLLIYKFRKGYQLSARWNYRTGRPFTMVNSQIDRDLISGSYELINSINGSRFPPYHRLDMSLDREWKTRKKGIKNWFGISLYNAYNRVNPYYAYPAGDGKKLRVIGMFPLIPSFHFGFELGGNKRRNNEVYQK